MCTCAVSAAMKRMRRVHCYAYSQRSQHVQLVALGEGLTVRMGDMVMVVGVVVVGGKA